MYVDGLMELYSALNGCVLKDALVWLIINNLSNDWLVMCQFIPHI